VGKPQTLTPVSENNARGAFAGEGHPIFTIVVKASLEEGFVERSGINANLESRIGSADQNDYVEQNSPGSTAPISERAMAKVNAIEMTIGVLDNISQASDTALRYRYDVYASNSDANNLRVEVTAYMVNNDGKVVSYKPYAQQALDLLNLPSN